ncbi:helix-turn-helix domain-containing protein [Virgibacillus salexigens]|uniref:helix-turn-helix domain-containing protein n=1 Tax=Virgibacillus salexigens TaxID=61016 RepID=UPI003081CED4
MDLDKIIGAKLKELRKNKEYSTRESGRMIGVSNSYISKIENGKIPSLSILQKLCNVYGVNISYLFNNDKTTKNLDLDWSTCIEELKKKGMTPSQTLKYTDAFLKLKEVINGGN